MISVLEREIEKNNGLPDKKLHVNRDKIIVLNV